MEKSILAHLGGRLARQQEPLATDGLAYLLARSPACVGVIRQLARLAGSELPEAMRFRVEVAGEDLERPDIVGTDVRNVEVLLIEGKFDAGLTDNQPGAYLRRLGRGGSGLLLFVVPDLRVPHLWRVIAERAGVSDVGEEHRTRTGIRFRAVDPSRTLAMISWRALLDLMLHAAGSESDPIAADVRQLQSLCARFEGEAFLPFTGEELLGVQLPRRHRDLCDVVDAIVDTLAAKGQVSLTGLRATPVRMGYNRYLRVAPGPIGEAGISLKYDAWRAFQTSPIWFEAGGSALAISGPVLDGVGSETGRQVVYQNGRVLLPLPVEPNLEREEIVVRCVAVVSRIIERLGLTAAAAEAHVADGAHGGANLGALEGGADRTWEKPQEDGP